MDFKLVIDWKFVAALGAAASMVILSSRIDGGAAERVLANSVDACMGLMSASNCGH